MTRILGPFQPYLIGAAVLAVGGAVWFVMDLPGRQSRSCR